MRLKKWLFAGLVPVIAGLLQSSLVAFSRAEPGTDANASSQEEFRAWTDRSGTYHVEAVLVGF